MLDVTCEHCGTILKISEEYLGQTGTCNHCHRLITVTVAPLKFSAETIQADAESEQEKAANTSFQRPVPPSVQYLGTRPHYEDAQPPDQRPLYMGIAGAILLFAGTFAPLFSVPLLGHLNYFANGRGDGVIVILLAVAAFIMTLARRFRYLYILGLIALGVMCVTFFIFQVTLNEVTQQMHENLQGNPFVGMAEVMVNSVQMQWGWIVLVIGAGLIIAASAVSNKASPDANISVLLGIVLAITSAVAVGTIAALVVTPITCDILMPAMERAEELSATAEESAYMDEIELSNVSVEYQQEYSFSDPEPYISGTIINHGERTLREVQIVVYFYDESGTRVGESDYYPVLVSEYSFGHDNIPLKPDYVKDFGYKLTSSAPSTWSGDVDVEIANIEFMELSEEHARETKADTKMESLLLPSEPAAPPEPMLPPDVYLVTDAEYESVKTGDTLDYVRVVFRGMGDIAKEEEIPAKSERGASMIEQIVTWQMESGDTAALVFENGVLTYKTR